MDIRLIKSWATPSTLHLRVMITGKDNRWHSFKDLHLAIDDLDESVIAILLTAPGDDSAPQEPLAGL